MAENNEKHTLSDRIEKYKDKYKKLDKKGKMQVWAIVFLIVVILITASTALMGKGETPVPHSEAYESSEYESSSQSQSSYKKYEDKYLKQIKEYDDVVIPLSETKDKNYIKETLFVGDSNTEGLAAYHHLPLQQVLGVTGMPIQNVIPKECMWFVEYDTPVNIPTAVGMLKPRRIIINYGTNNAGGTDTDDFIYHYERTLDRIEKAYPYADIIVASVLPVGKQRSYPSITMKDIDEFNIALAEMCRERGLKFLNTAEAFKDPDNGYAKKDCFAKDGIHLTSKGYKTLLKYVDDHQYIVPDERPARGAIPTRREAPEEISSSSDISSSMSSSFMSSSNSVISSSVIEPTPTPTPTPTPLPEPTPEPTPTPTPIPEVIPTPEPEVSPTTKPEEIPTPDTVPTVPPEPFQTVPPIPTPEVIIPPVPTPEIVIPPEPTPDIEPPVPTIRPDIEEEEEDD